MQRSLTPPPILPGFHRRPGFSEVDRPHGTGPLPASGRTFVGGMERTVPRRGCEGRGGQAPALAHSAILEFRGAGVPPRHLYPGAVPCGWGREACPTSRSLGRLSLDSQGPPRRPSPGPNCPTTGQPPTPSIRPPPGASQPVLPRPLPAAPDSASGPRPGETPAPGAGVKGPCPVLFRPGPSRPWGTGTREGWTPAQASQDSPVWKKPAAASSSGRTGAVSGQSQKEASRSPSEPISGKAGPEDGAAQAPPPHQGTRLAQGLPVRVVLACPQGAAGGLA